MEKKNKRQIGGAIGLGILILGLLWTWSLGAVTPEEGQKTSVEVTQGTVEWKNPSSDEWHKVSGTQELNTGDSLRTDETGEANIRWGDRGETRLDANTEIFIDSTDSGEALLSTVLKIKVESGRIWNRVFKVLNLDSGMQVETSDVVATVRGTAFGVAKTSANTDIAVTESVVSVPEALIREGQWGSFNASGTVEMRQLTDADTWALQNKEKDVAFDAGIKEQLLERFQRRLNVQAPVWLINLSEQGHLAVLAGDKKKDLAEKYALRHLAFGVLREKNRDAQFTALQKRIKIAEGAASRLLSEVHALSIAFSTETYSARQEAGDMETRLRDLRSNTAIFSEGAKLYQEALSIDDRIDDYLFGPNDPVGRSKKAKQILLDLTAYTEALERRSDLSVPVREQLLKKTEAMGYRLGFDEFTLNGDHTFGDIPLAGEEQGAATSTVMDETSASSSADGVQNNKQDAAPRFTVFQFYATPIKTPVDQPVRLALYGVTADGVAINVTKDALFGMAEPATGSMQANYFTPSKPGTVTLYATITDGGVTKRFTTSVTVEATTTMTSGIQDLQFQFQGSTDLPCSASLPFKVMAMYADGSTKDVTIMSRQSVSDPQLIHVQDDKVFTYCSAKKATAEVYATYEEGGLRFTAVGTITVTPEPQPVTTAPSTPSATFAVPPSIY